MRISAQAHRVSTPVKIAQQPVSHQPIDITQRVIFHLYLSIIQWLEAWGITALKDLCRAWCSLMDFTKMSHSLFIHLYFLAQDLLQMNPTMDFS